MSSTSIAIHPEVEVLWLSSVVIQLATSPPVPHFSAVYVVDVALQGVDESHRPGAYYTGYYTFFSEEKFISHTDPNTPNGRNLVLCSRSNRAKFHRIPILHVPSDTLPNNKSGTVSLSGVRRGI